MHRSLDSTPGDPRPDLVEEARLTTTTTARPPDVDEPAPRRPTRGRRVAAELGVVVAYLLASGLLYHRVLGDLAGRATGAVSSDSSLFTWWLGWTWYAVGHGLDPLTSTGQNAPDGVNGMWNTGVPVLGVLLAPVTATAGPVVADNVAMILGPAVSAYAAHRALAVLVGPRWIRALAGLVYGFSPFLVAHAWVGHANLVWSVLPPVVLWASVRVLAGRGPDRSEVRPWRDGALLGLAFAVQVWLYTQTVALGAVALAVVAVVLAVSAPRAVWRRLPALARSLAAAGVVVAVLCAWPAWVLLRGPSRPRGPIRDALTVGADAANLVVPSPLTAIRPGTDALAAGLRAYPGEQGSYLGVAMLVVFLAAVVLVRSRAVFLTAVVTVLLGVASLGTSLAVLGRDTGVPLPWRVLADVPLLGQAEAGRLAPFVALGVVAVWALALAHLTRPGASPATGTATGTGRACRLGRAVVVVGVLAAAVTWVPVDDQRTTPADAPAFFTAGAPGLGPAGPDGGPPIVEMVPRPSQVWQGGGDPLRWQALAGYSFRQTGGYFIGGSETAPVVYEGEVGAFQRGVADGGRGDVAAARADLAARHVSAIVVVPTAVTDPDSAVRWARAVGGGPGRYAEGVWIVPVCPAGRCGA
ncbi:MAG: hypothetical protein QOE59_4845 [Actinomycetota bacterium]|nr:hypothetical protein [Actinomycetota bacterium]